MDMAREVEEDGANMARASARRTTIAGALLSNEGDPSAPQPEYLMSILAREFTVAFRSLRKSPSFTLAAVLTLALGISSTTAIFSVVQSVLLKPLPFPTAERIVVPQSKKISTDGAWSITYADFMDWRDAHVFDKVALIQFTQMDLTGGADPVRLSAVAVSPQFFDALRAEPAKGRLLQPADYPVDASRAVVISDRLWRTQFGARPDIVGLEVEVNAIKRPVVGVLPPDAEWPVGTDLWVPMRIATEQDPDLQRRDNYIFSGVARLKPGATLEGTRAAMALLALRAAEAHPDIRKDITTIPTPALTWLLGPTTPRTLWILLGAVVLLLLIGCVNVANLQLARAAARQRELALHAALGATRWRLARRTLVESGVLALLGGLLGVALAEWMVRLVVLAAPTGVPRIASVAVNGPVLAFALLASIAVAALFGVAPALHAARSDPQAALGDGGARTSGGRAGLRTRRTLVVVELALSVVLLVGAGLAIRSIQRLRAVDPGVDTHDVLTASISVPSVRYNSSAKVVAFMNDLRERIAATPGIVAAGIASASPLGGGGFYLGRAMIAEGRGTSPSEEVSVNWNVATPGYFDALHVPILRGRDFTVRDDTTAPPVMIVNAAFAKAMFPNENPIGKRAMSSRDEKVYREIIGVVRDIKYYGASDSLRALVWVPYAQRNAWSVGVITVRTRDNPLTALPILKRELGALDGAIALANVATMDETMAHSMAGDALVARLLSAFAGLALVLAAIGIFGVLSYLVEQRTHELGIRVALGAQRSDVLGVVMRETIPMVGIGVVAGLGGALGLARYAQSMLYEARGVDPVTFLGVGLLLMIVAVLAAAIPARRASRVDPMIALRSE
jgi:putative ABC transport system permease protein